MRLTKTYASYTEALIAHTWYMRLNARYRPSNLLIDGAKLSYDWIDGTHPSNIEDIIEAADDALWYLDDGAVGHGPINPAGYVEYARSVAREVGASNPRALDMIRGYSKYTPVHTCHGDLTFANIIKTHNDKMIFIDPGNPRGLSCKEIDVAKLMQSLDGYHVVRDQWPDPPCLPKLGYSSIHLALLSTHYTRLLRHKHPVDVYTFARERVYALERLL